jgi:hypothetical protein
MSERERKLLLFFGAAGVILLCFWGYKSYTGKRMEIEMKRQQAQQTLDQAKLFMKSRDAVADEIEWLAKHEPQPEAGEQVPSKLQALAAAEGTRAGLTMKKQDILAATQKEGQENMRYRRAQVKFTVTGDEKKIYAWFDRMHSPDDFRVISELAFVTNREDDSLIDCVVTFDQWYVPLPPEI